MELDSRRWYSFCEAHEKKIESKGKWEEPEDYRESCDFTTSKGVRCGKPAKFEFSLAREWH